MNGDCIYYPYMGGVGGGCGSWKFMGGGNISPPGDSKGGGLLFPGNSRERVQLLENSRGLRYIVLSWKFQGGGHFG